MKKSILIFILILVALFCSCGQQNKKTQSYETYNFETDMQYYYRYQSFVYPITASGDGYYVVGEKGIVIYVDKKTMKATPLCNKPNCKHNDPETCNGYLLNSSYNILDISLEEPYENVIQYYDGSLYAMDFEFNNDRESYEPFLVKYDLDGTKYTKVTNNLNGISTLEDWFIHRGYFYYVTDHEICRISMDSPKSKAETLYEIKDYFEAQNNISEIKAYGDYIYFKANIDVNKETENYKIKKLYLNVSTLECKETNLGNDNVRVQTFYNGKAVFMLSNGTSTDYYSCDLNMENSSLLTTQKIGCMLSGDEKYMYVDNGNKLLASNSKSNSDKYLGQTITAYDSNMNKVDSFIFPSETVYPYLGGHDENNFLVFMEDKANGDYTLYYIDKSQIGSFKGKAVELKALCKLNLAEENTANNYTID